MFRFANPQYLYLLILIPIFILVYMIMRRQMKRRLKEFGDMALLAGLMPDVSSSRRNIKFALMMFSLGLIIFILARPQFGTRNEEVKRTGIETIIAVDVSNSMLCEDIKPSRLSKAKMLVSKLIDQFDNDRIGLVAFAGNAITLLPVTSDYVSAKMFLDQLAPSTISLQGTDISAAIQQASRGFSKNKNIGHALILITDAEDNEDGALEAAKKLSESGVRIFVLSIGTSAGGPIPMGNGSYKTDASGNVVTTSLNESIGKSIAKAGNGVYIHVDQTEQAQNLLSKEIEKMQKDEISSTLYSEYDEQFFAVAIILFIVLLVEMCIMERHNPLFRGIKLFR